MGTCFPKSKCADLGRSLRTGASTTCLQTRSASTSGPALSQSWALDFVWLCLWHFRFRFFAWLRSCCWPLALLGSEQDPTPLPGPPPRFPPEASAPRALFAVFAKYSSRIFYLFEEALRGSFEMANSGAPRHEQVLWVTRAGLGGRHLDAWPLKGVGQCAGGHELSFSLCHKQKSSVELLGWSHG